MFPLLRLGLENTAILKGRTTPSAAYVDYTDTEIAVLNNAPTYDVGLRYFALGADFKTLTIANNFPVTGDPVGWNVGTTQIIPAPPWIEVTDSIHFNGAFDYEWNDNKITWSATLQGQNYNATYFGAGKALLCMRRTTCVGFDSGWTLWWLGCIEAGGYTDNYKHGMNWQRTVKGVDATLKTTDAPRLVVGKTNLAADASVSVSTTLAVPAEEIPNHEFIGATANVEGNNIVDERLNTLWIAQYPPSVIADTLPLYHNTQAQLKIDELFFSPVTGYDPRKTWWFEIVSMADKMSFGSGAFANGWIATLNADGVPVAVHLSGFTSELNFGERVVVCANRKRFEEYTGGANGAMHIFETDTLPECYRIINYTQFSNPLPDTYYDTIHLDTSVRMSFTPNPVGGYLYLTPYYAQAFRDLDGIKWGYNEPLPSGARESFIWQGANIPLPATGQSMKRKPSGGGVQTGYGSNNYDSNTAADWVLSDYPRPGDKYEANQFEWALLELKAHTSTLSALAGSTVNQLTFDEGVEGWPASGIGVIEGDTFTYSERSSSALEGVTGLVDDHVVGALAYPYYNNLAQTGWLVSSLEIKRPLGLAYLKRIEVYFSPYANTDSPDGTNASSIDWQGSYEPPSLSYYNGLNGMTGPIGQANIYLEPNTGGSRWIRSLLILVHDMWPDPGATEAARAKINEVFVYPDDLTVNDNIIMTTDATGNMQQSTAAEVIRYLLANYSWLTAADIRNDTFDGWGFVHTFSSAITPITRVVEDLARTHGCVVHYHPAGQILIERDPWWPGGLDQATYYYVGGTNYGPIYNFGLDSLRADFNLEDSLPEVLGVAIVATDSQGNPLERVTAPPGVTGTTVKEYTDVVVPNIEYARSMAYKFQLKETDTQKLNFTIKGPGTWLRPGYIIFVSWNAVVALNTWIIENIHYTWNNSGNQKQWTAAVECRRLF